MDDNYYFYILIAGIGIGGIHLILKYILRLKCDNCSICWNCIRCTRDITDEITEHRTDLEHGIRDSNIEIPVFSNNH